MRALGGDPHNPVNPIEGAFEMRKMMAAAAAFALALGVSTTAFAVEIHNLSGQSCGDFSGSWHFVLNNAPAGVEQSLTASWSSGDTCGPVGPYKTNGQKT